jgi:hypothetical protein
MERPTPRGVDVSHGDLAISNSLTDLAARIRAEHEATGTALKSSVEHAMMAGDLLIEAKSRLKHGQWMPWLTKHCAMSDRTAQLYVKIAKNRTTIETNIRNAVADLTLGQAAALMMMTADMKKVLDFVKQVETTDDPEKIIGLCIEHGFPVIQDSNYNPFANCTEAEQREWGLFALFLARSASVDGVLQHVEWVLQRPFKNVAEWLGDEGTEFRWWAKPIPAEHIELWRAFAAEHESLTAAGREAELDRTRIQQLENPRPIIKAKRGQQLMKQAGP